MGVAGAAAPRRVLLLGYDGDCCNGREHFDDPPGHYRNGAAAEDGQLALFCYQYAAELAAQHDVEVLNCSRQTVIDAFERADLEVR